MYKFKTLKDHVYDYIAQQIMDGNLSPGKKINEAEICDELSISRTPVREALIQLASEQILENVPRKGFVLRQLTSKEARELYEVIGHLDALAAHKAYDRLTAQDYKDMEFYIESMDIAIDSENYSMYYRQQIEFHNVYILKCDNDILLSEMQRLKNKFLKKNYVSDPAGKMHDILRQTNDEHREILRMFMNGEKAKLPGYIASVHWATEQSEFDLMGD